MAETQTEMLSDTTRGLISDIERVLGQRLGRLQKELIQELSKASTAGASLGSGIGLAALGTILGGMGFVHLVNKATGLPLWLCYAGSSAIACSAAAGLLTKGAQQVGEMDIVPEGAGRLAREVATANGH